MEELVSIIVPVFNAARLIRRCTDSLFSQTYSNLEIIFVDDCSSDNSVEVLESLTASQKDNHRVVLIRQSYNQGPGAARKVGVEKAQGKWCVFVDSDDWVEPQYIEHLMCAAKSDVDFVVSGVLYEYEDLPRKSRKKQFEGLESRRETVGAEILSDVINYSFPFGKVFRTDIIKENNLLVDGITLHEDTAFVMGYLCHINRIVFIDYCDYHYVFWAANSLSRKQRNAKELLAISDTMFSAWDRLFEAFSHVKPNDMRQCIQRYGLSQLLQAVFSAYAREKLTMQEASVIVSAARRRKEEFDRYYVPSSSLIRILLFLVLHVPFVILHCMLRVGVLIKPNVKIV